MVTVPRELAPFQNLRKRPLTKITESDVSTSWVSYIIVEDFDATFAKAQELGAHLCMPVGEIPGCTPTFPGSSAAWKPGPRKEILSN